MVRRTQAVAVTFVYWVFLLLLAKHAYAVRATITGGSINNTPIGGETPSTANFTESQTEKPFANVLAYGAVMDGTTDDRAALVAAIDNSIQAGHMHVVIPRGAIKVSATIFITNRHVRISGAWGSRWDGGSHKGTEIRFTGTGPLFQLDVDDGDSWDCAGAAACYDGTQGFMLENLILKYTGSGTSNLENNWGTYGTGTYGIKDWRGGDIQLRNVAFENFEYGFWGIQSDINRWDVVNFVRNHIAIYLGPRSDQLHWNHGYTFYNDQVLIAERVVETRITNTQFVDEGLVDKPVFDLRTSYFADNTAWNGQTSGFSFVDCWFEKFNSGNGTDNTYTWIRAGENTPGLVYNVADIHIVRPVILNSSAGANEHMKYLVTVDNAVRVEINDINHSPYLQNLESIVEFVGTTSPAATITANYDIVTSLGWAKIFKDNTTSGNPVGGVRGKTGYATFFGGWRSAIAGGVRLYFQDGADATRNFFISQEGASGNRFLIKFYADASGNYDFVDFQRRIIPGTAAPSSSTWVRGDYVYNYNPSELGTAGSKYIIRGWSCVTGGSPGTWVEDRGLTGN